MHAVVATAGHVDHGKSTLVRALTGIEPDRWDEEHRRGLTIDLGFAWTTLPSGAELGFVDVPGHQRFIANMLTGIGPAPAVLFVVAADGGWSRQSDEHLAAIDALGIEHGLLAVTRSDLADPGPAIRDARTRLAATGLGRVEAVAVSGTTGAGLDELRVTLDRVVAHLPRPDGHAPVRLWLDRSFSVKGAGTVVTGTLGAGTVRIGDQLALGDRTVTVRGVQTAGGDVASARGVTRVALNLRGVRADEIGRGDALLTPGTQPSTVSIDVRVTAHEHLPRELVLHAGTAAVPVHVRALDTRHARLSLSNPLPLVLGDRAVLRDPGRQSVAGGVLVLDVDPPPLRRRGAAAARARELSGRAGVPRRAAAPKPEPTRTPTGSETARDATAALLTRFADNPFAAPERDELAALGLGHRALAAAHKRGDVLLLTPDVVVGVGAGERALDALRALPQPFTTSEARQALGVTRRVAVPLLEHLDATGRTERLDGTRRTVTP